MKEPFNTFRALLGLKWFVNSNGIIESRREEISLADDNRIVHIPLGEREDRSYVEQIAQDREDLRNLYSISTLPTTKEEEDFNSSGEIELESDYLYRQRWCLRGMGTRWIGVNISKGAFGKHLWYTINLLDVCKVPQIQETYRKYTKAPYQHRSNRFQIYSRRQIQKL